MARDIVRTTPTALRSDSAVEAAEPRSKNAAAVYLSAFASEQSRRTMRACLNNLADVLQPRLDGYNRQRCLLIPWHELRFQHTAALRARLMDLYAPATVNKHLSALRGVLKASWRLGLMNADDYYAARDIEDVSGETVPAGRDLASGEMLALSSVCASDSTPAGARDAALIAVLYTCGLRRSELVNLDVADLDISSGKLTIRGGKGRKDRTVYASNGALSALTDWLTVRGDSAGALFCPVNKAGRIRIKPMTSQAVYNLLKRRAAQAHVKDFSPHDFRRTFVGDLLDRGVDIVTVQHMAGHASVNTTGRYDRRPEEVKRQAAAKLHFPYQKRTGA